MPYNNQIYGNVVSQGLKSGQVIEPSNYSGFIKQSLMRISDIEATEASLSPRIFSVIYSKFMNKTNNSGVARVLSVAFIDACNFNKIDPLRFIDTFVYEESDIYKLVVEYTNVFRNADTKHEITSLVSNRDSVKYRQVSADNAGDVDNGDDSSGTPINQISINEVVISSNEVILMAGGKIDAKISSNFTFDTVDLIDVFGDVITYNDLSPILSGDEFIVDLSFFLSDNYSLSNGSVYVNAIIRNNNLMSPKVKSNELDYLVFDIILDLPIVEYSENNSGICGDKVVNVKIPFNIPDSFDGLEPDLTVSVNSDVTEVSNISIDYDNNLIDIDLISLPDVLSLSDEDNVFVSVTSNLLSGHKKTAFNVKVVDEAPYITNSNVPSYKIEGIYDVNINFSQSVKVLSVNNQPNSGVIISNINNSNYTDNIEFQLSLSLTDIPSEQEKSIYIEVESMCGKSHILEKRYTIKPISELSITLTSPQKEAKLPVSFSSRNFVVTATINTKNPLPLDMDYKMNSLFFNSGNDFTLEDRPDGQYIVINEPILRDFYYVNGITMDILIVNS